MNRSVSAATVTVQAGQNYIATLTVSDRDTFTNIDESEFIVEDNPYCTVQIRDLAAGSTITWAEAGYSNNTYTFVHTKTAITHFNGDPITEPIVLLDRYWAIDTRDAAIFGAVHDHLMGPSGIQPFGIQQTVTVTP